MRYRVQVTMDEELYQALAEQALKQSRTRANLILHALRGYLSRYSHGCLPDALRVRAKAADGQE